MRDKYREDGYTISSPILDARELDAARDEAARLLASSSARGGARSVLSRSTAFRELAQSVLKSAAQELLGTTAEPVKATLFEKSPAANWKVPWHQDLTIAVAERIEVPGFGPWSTKDGTPHVQPPASILERLVAVRLHLDDTPTENGALRVIPGSHRYGRLDGAAAQSLRARGPEVVCPVSAGGLLLMSPLLLHASSPARHPSHRRILHVEFSGVPLPGGLSWAV